MQAIKGYMIAVRQLIKRPEHTVHIDPFGDGERESIWNRESAMLTIDGSRASQLDRS